MIKKQDRLSYSGQRQLEASVYVVPIYKARLLGTHVRRYEKQTVYKYNTVWKEVLWRHPYNRTHTHTHWRVGGGGSISVDVRTHTIG